MTQDIDLLVDNAATAASMNGLVLAWRQSEFLFDETSVRSAVRNKRMVQLMDAQESLKLDVYPRELIAGELSRSETQEVFDGVKLPDAAVSKLIWISKGSHKNRCDVRQIISRATPSQRTTIDELVIRLELKNLLEEVLAESDEIE